MSDTAVSPEQAAPEKQSWRENGGVRGWFGRQPSWVRVIVVLVVAVLAYLLPYVGSVPLIGPQIVTQGIDWPSALFDMSYYVAAGAGFERGGRFRRPAGPGLCGLLRGGRLCDGVVDFAGQRDSHAVGVVGGGADRAGRDDVGGLVVGWPTLRLRGDYLAIVTLGFAEIIRIVATSTPDVAG